MSVLTVMVACTLAGVLTLAPNKPVQFDVRQLRDTQPCQEGWWESAYTHSINFMYQGRRITINLPNDWPPGQYRMVYNWYDPEVNVEASWIPVDLVFLIQGTMRPRSPSSFRLRHLRDHLCDRSS